MKKFLIVLCLLPLLVIHSSSAKTVSEPQETVTQTFAAVPDLYIPSISQEAERTLSQAIKNRHLRSFLEDDFIDPGELRAVNTVTLSFAGDCTLGGDEKYKGRTFDKVYQEVNNPAYFFEGVKSIFGTDDFTFVNLEGTLTTATEKAEKEFRYRGDPSYAQILVKGSVEGVTLANNHTLDYFEAGFDDTVNALDDAGIYHTCFESSFIREIKGLKIGFLGLKGFSYENISNDLLKDNVKEMREQGVDFIVANYHWGVIRSYTPNAQQIRMAHFAIDHGADLVIGHHPHVMQGMETYKGKNILYSLGNFCYGGSSNPSDKDTIIYQHKISFDITLDQIVHSEFQIIPACISSDPKRNNYQPVIATGDEEVRIRQKFRELCEKLAN